MSHSDIIKEHTINDTLYNIQEKIEAALNEAEEDIEALQALNRIEAIINNFKISYRNCLEIFIDVVWLDECNTAIQRITALLDSYCNNRAISYIITDVNQYLRVVLNTIVKLNCVRNRQSLKGTTEAFDVYVNSLFKVKESFDEKADEFDNKLDELNNEITKSNEQLEVDIDALKKEIDKEQLRLDGFADKYQEQKQDDQEKFLEFMSNAKTKFDEDKDAFDIRKEALIDEYKLAMDECVNHARTIVGVVDMNMFSYKYKEVANDAKKRAGLWHSITLFLLCGLIIFALCTFMIPTSQESGMVELMTKIFTTSAIATAAAYTARQASKQERVERYARQIEMELVSLEPYLLSLDDSTKEKIKEELAYKYFGKEDVMELKKNDNDDAKLLEKFTDNILQRLGKVE